MPLQDVLAAKVRHVSAQTPEASQQQYIVSAFFSVPNFIEATGQQGLV